MNSFLADLFTRRGTPESGYNSIWFLELNGATIILPTAFEPDPNTSHDPYYYNAIVNALYKKTSVGNNVYCWKKISD